LTRSRDQSSLNHGRKRSFRQSSRPDSPFQTSSGQSLKLPDKIDSPKSQASQVIKE